MTVTIDSKDRIVKCRKILDSDPTSQIFAALAEAYRKNGELEEAFTVCQKGLRIHPSYGPAHIVMARVSVDRGMYDWAETEVKKSIELEGPSRATDLLLAEVLLYKKECDKAIKLLRSLYNADTYNRQVCDLLDIAERMKQETVSEQAAHENASNVPLETESDRPDQRLEDSSVCKPVELLHQIAAINGIQGGLFIDADGTVVESEWSSQMNSSVCAEAMEEVVKRINSDLVNSSFGKVDSVLVETGSTVLYIVQVTDGTLLVVGDGRTNLGTVRLNISALLNKYQPKRAG
ncbi:MAG: hypothetical protein DRP45_05070 [Candidatus Zixiibacteriota bacterium]|nr:MAG: hypothetical protein DRP45_05070 [candidate division Zixibacteria bacterium]